MFVDSKWFTKLAASNLPDRNEPNPGRTKRLDDILLTRVLYGAVDHKHQLPAETREWLQFMGFALNFDKIHYGQLAQDLWILWETKQKRNGYFVEFGGANGKALSNTYLLEKKFGWSGIVAEPNVDFHSQLKANRDCDISTLCVAPKTGERVRFHCTRIGELSRMADFASGDKHNRADFKEIEVETISLNDLLDKYTAPDTIDYLSIDTEGSEYSILSNYDWAKRRIRYITVEHNGTNFGDKIFDLLSSVGYERKFRQFTRFDHWYVLREYT